MSVFIALNGWQVLGSGWIDSRESSGENKITLDKIRALPRGLREIASKPLAWISTYHGERVFVFEG